MSQPAITDMSQVLGFSLALAAFGDIVGGAPFANGYTYDDDVALAQSARGGLYG